MALLEEVAKTTIKLMVQEPFYGHFFLNVLKQEADSEDATIGIGLGASGLGALVLSVGARHWNETLSTQALRYGAIKHQILHLVFEHMLKAHQFGNHKLFDIAADLVVNQYLSSKQRAKGAVMPTDFPNLRLEPYQDVGYYYRALNSLRDGTGDGAAEEGSAFESDMDRLSQLLSEVSADDHSGWADFSTMGDGERSIFASELHRWVCLSADRAERSIGRLPGGLRLRLDAIRALVEPQVPWKRVLRLFSSTSRRTSIRNTIRRPSKRYGSTPGIKVVRHQRLLVAIDTSGSVSQDELAAFFGEIHRIYKQGAEVFVVECDVEIGSTYQYTGKVPGVISGRGGTSFEAPIRYANEVCQPDALIYFTDGFAPTPETRSRKPVLWVISSKGLSEASSEYVSLPGRKVKMQFSVAASR